MLVLSRKVGEKVVIDGNITLQIVKIQGNRITVGIEAPSDVKILRGELAQAQSSSIPASQSQSCPQSLEFIVEDGLLVAC